MNSPQNYSFVVMRGLVYNVFIICSEGSVGSSDYPSTPKIPFDFRVAT